MSTSSVERKAFRDAAEAEKALADAIYPAWDTQQQVVVQQSTTLTKALATVGDTLTRGAADENLASATTITNGYTGTSKGSKVFSVVPLEWPSRLMTGDRLS